MAELRALFLLFAGVLLVGCAPAKPVGVPTSGTSGEADDGAGEALQNALSRELATIEAALGRAPDDEALLERRLLVSVMMAELERGRDDRAPPPDRAALERLAVRQLAAIRDRRGGRQGSGGRKPKPVFTLDEQPIEESDDPLSGLSKDDDWGRGPEPAPQAAVVMDAQSAVPPAVQRALDEQMSRVAPCLPGAERRRVVVRAKWYGDRMRDVGLSAEPSLIPAVSACLVEALEGMRLPSSGAMARVLVFPVGID